MAQQQTLLWLALVVAVLGPVRSATVARNSSFGSSLYGSVDLPEDELFLQAPVRYHTTDQLSAAFNRLAKYHPDLAAVHSVGRSREGRDLIAIQIGRRSVHERALLVPMFKYVGNMHGDETVGRELLVYLAEYLVRNYGRLAAVRRLVDNTDIWLLPSMNPDGFENSEEGRCESRLNYVGRNNAGGQDLNRDFPDRLESDLMRRLRPNAKQPETLALIDWIRSNPFVLSANLHGGAVVASYPYDNTIQHQECCEDSPSPDNAMFKRLATVYASNHPVMRTGNNCNETFPGGITNGAYWYELNGGMQDYNYVNSNCLEITLELSCCKYPAASELPGEWQRNKRSLLAYMQQTHTGFKGLVLDVNGYPVHGASVYVEHIEQKPMRTTERGEYWRLLVPGTYNVYTTAFGFEKSTVHRIVIAENSTEPLRLDFKLIPARNVEAEGFRTPTLFVHHSNEALMLTLHELADRYPDVTRLHTIGQSVEHRDLWVLVIGRTPGQHRSNVAEVKFVANMHGNEVVGREMLLLLAKYLCENDGHDERVTRILNTTRVHLLPSMNPDGYERAREGDEGGLVGRQNANGVDLNRNFPDQYGQNELNAVAQPETAAVMNWTRSVPFVLSANLHNGALVANYPFDDRPDDFVRIPVMGGGSTVAKPGGTRVPNYSDDNELFRHLALTYSNAHPRMHLGKPCEHFLRDVFADGITNGAAWYSVTGGMQDWNYNEANVFELTLELGCQKFPLAIELPTYWAENREPLLRYIEQAQHSITGFIRSSIGTPIANAAVRINGGQHAARSAANGEYWRLLAPDQAFNITVQAPNYELHFERVQPKNATAPLVYDISLMNADPQHWSSAYDFRVLDNVVRTRYHGDAQLKATLAELERRNALAAVFDVNDSPLAQAIPALRVTADIGGPEENKFHVLVLGGLADAEPTGRELTVNLARHVLAAYQLQEPLYVRMLQNAVLHFAPLTRNFDAVHSRYMTNNQNGCVFGKPTEDQWIDRLLAADSPDAEPLLQLLHNGRFDLLLTFAAGGNDTIRPVLADQTPNGTVWSAQFDRMRAAIAEQRPEDGQHDAERCERLPDRTRAAAKQQQFVDSVWRLFGVPAFVLQTTCCAMVTEPELATTWRRHIHPVLNFMWLLRTGIEGRVVRKGRPTEALRNATLEIAGRRLAVTRNRAHFKVPLMAGRFELVVRAPGCADERRQVTVKTGELLDLGEIELRADDANPSAFGALTPVSETGDGAALPAMQPFASTLSAALPSSTTAVQQRQPAAAPSGALLTGLVLDTEHRAVPGAMVRLRDALSDRRLGENRTDTNGMFAIMSSDATRGFAGNATLQIEARGRIASVRNITIGPDASDVPLRVRLEPDDTVLGIPRLLFVVSAGCLGVVLVACCAMSVNYCQQRRQRRFNNYTFAALATKASEKQMFDDDDDDEDNDETELFRQRPIKKHVMQPYYDDEDLSAVDRDDGDDEEDDGRAGIDVELDGMDSENEIVLIHR